MANNRLYIRCKGCNEVFFLAKYFPTPGWFIPLRMEGEIPTPISGHKDTPTERVNQLESFLNGHNECAVYLDDYVGMIGATCFELEFDSLFEIKKEQA